MRAIQGAKDGGDRAARNFVVKGPKRQPRIPVHQHDHTDNTWLGFLSTGERKKGVGGELG